MKVKLNWFFWFLVVPLLEGGEKVGAVGEGGSRRMDVVMS